MTDKFVIGVDLGYTTSDTGFAVLGRDNKFIQVEHFHLDGDMHGPKIVQFRDKMEDSLTHGLWEYDIEMLVWEEPHCRNVATFRGLGYLEGQLMALCEDYNIPYLGVHNATIKKAICGTGAAKKPDMLRKACNIAGRDITNQDEADAILCAAYAWQVVEGQDVK